MNNDQKLKDVFGIIFNVDTKTITNDSSMDNVDGWDSLKHLNLVLALESEFQVSFTEEESVIITSYELVRAVLKDHGVSFI